MKLGSLFDGSGGFPLAGSLCGITPAWASEIEPYPIAVTSSRFPNMKHLGSVTDIHGGEIEPVDIITFGSPCQDLSVAGKRAGLKHEDHGDDETTRSGLFMEAIRIIKEMRKATNGIYPRIAVWENVPGAFSNNKGEDFRTVLTEFVRIKEPEAPEVPAPGKDGWPTADIYMGDGWSIAYRVFDAQYWGVPQRRRRIYLVADFRGQCAGKISFERQGLRGYFTPCGTQGERTAGDTESCAGTDDYAECVIGAEVYDARENGDGKVVNTVTGDHNGHISDYTSVVCFCMATQQGGAEIMENKCPTITAAAGMSGNNQPVVCVQQAYDKYMEAVVYCMASGQANAEILKDKSPTLNCTSEQPIVFYKYIVRRMTPIECARVQGFADHWGDIDEKADFTDAEYQFWLNVRNTHASVNGKAVKEYTKAQMLKWYNGLHTDSAEYKMWGNGIALPCALYIMQGIAEVLE